MLADDSAESCAFVTDAIMLPVNNNNYYIMLITIIIYI